MAGTLYIVATPIGNLEDITFRAVAVLKSVSAIACEDTRQTRKLLDHFGISTPALSYHEHNEAARAAELGFRLAAGESIALVSDAGTPLISDPGYRLVAQAIEQGAAVVPIPGACAAVAALSASGLATDEFHFGGFLSPKRGRRRSELEPLRQAGFTAIFYEAPHRIVETLADIAEVLGPARPVVVAREVSKLHEEFLRGTAQSVHDELARRESVKGEITLLIGKPEAAATVADPASLRDQVERLAASGVSRMDAIKQVAHAHGIGKRHLYKIMEEA
ncbi:MAG: 16S rRNA (cytidine(1402)-2'-O)-methyltransferase [Bryobacteraceae bacterium]